MPFKRPTTTAVPDELFDYWLGHPDDALGAAELRVLLYITRRTLGFHKIADAVSIKQLIQGIKRRDGSALDYGCGIRNKTNLCKALAGLERRELIRALRGIDDDGGDVSTVYSLWFEGDLPSAIAHEADDPRRGAVKVPPVYRSSTPGEYRSSNLPSTVAVPSGVPQKHPQETVLQETETKRQKGHTSDQETGQALWSSVLDDLRLVLTPENYEAWLAPTRAVSLHEGVLTVAVARDFHKEWMEHKLNGRVLSALRRLGHPDVTVTYIIA